MPHFDIVIIGAGLSELMRPATLKCTAQRSGFASLKPENGWAVPGTCSNIRAYAPIQTCMCSPIPLSRGRMTNRSPMPRPFSTI